MPVSFPSASTSPWSRVVEIDARDQCAQAVDELLGLASDLGDETLGAEEGVVRFAARCNASAGWDRDARTEFAALVGTLLHELQHVHDFVGTYTGATLALLGLSAHVDAAFIVNRLQHWSLAGNSIPIPLDADWLAETFADDRLDRAWKAAREQAAEASRLWITRDHQHVVPGIRTRDLFETRGLLTQLQLTAGLFGADIATAVATATDWQGGHISSGRYGYIERVVGNLLGARHGLAPAAALLLGALDESEPSETTDGTSSPENFFAARGPATLLVDAAAVLRKVPPDGWPPEVLALSSVEQALQDWGVTQPRSDRLHDRRIQLRARVTDLAARPIATTAPTAMHAIAAAHALVDQYDTLATLRTDPFDGGTEMNAWLEALLVGTLPSVTVRVLTAGSPDGVFRTRSATAIPDASLMIEAERAVWQVLTHRRLVTDSEIVRRTRSEMLVGSSLSNLRVVERNRGRA
ncbi:hypothetical protein [Microbacterium sp. SS28]|uniref:hypothetical protein n=1 Tax=Microbacterium sp. SS28 TaxID=2919948 RepID=UPI001FAB0844|nr:hypothetical protein [Microbacterium sp. SS28]